MKELDYIAFSGRNEFRDWLQKNHNVSHGIWMVFFKKHTKHECISYNEALEEALCFGWIDSLIKKIDEERYARKFTPRTNVKKWSEINKRKVTELIANGLMTNAGLVKTEGYSNPEKPVTKTESRVKPGFKESDIPAFILEEFSKNEPALRNFNNLAPGYKRIYLLWITSAKQDTTIKKRLNESVALLKENKKLGLK